MRPIWPLLLCALPSAARAESLIVFTGDHEPSAAAVAAALQAEPALAGWTAETVVDPMGPAPGSLDGADVVLFYATTGWADSEATGDALALYVEAGGALLALAPGWTDGTAPGGALLLAAPIGPAAPGPTPGPWDGASIDPSLPLWDGLDLGDLLVRDLGQGAFEPGSVHPDAAILALDGSGQPAAATRCDRSFVVLQVPALDLLESPPTVTPQLSRWLANAVRFPGTDELPQGSAGGPYAVDEGESVTLDGAVIVEGSAGLQEIAWDLDDDGTFEVVGESSPVFAASSIDGPASRSIHLRVTDGCGRTVVSSTTVTVDNVAPSFLSHPLDGSVGEGGALTFVGEAADVVGDPLTLSWNWDDGAPTSAGSTVERAFADDAFVTGTLEVDDGDGGTASHSFVIDVLNLPPTLTALTGPALLDLAEVGTFQITSTDPAGAADPAAVEWALDGSPWTSGGASFSPSFETTGTHSVEVAVSDGDGGITSHLWSVEVRSPGPEITFIAAPTTVDEGAEASFAIDLSVPLDATATVLWSVDGTPAAGPTASLTTWTTTFPNDGVVEVTATATDPWGQSAVAAATVVVRNVPPAISTTPSVALVEGTTLSLELDAEDPGSDALLWSAVILPAGATLSPGGALLFTPTWEHATAGTVEFAVTVTDSDGGWDELVWTTAITLLDADGDSIPDTWEFDNGLDPTVANTGLDADGDGIDDLSEYTLGRDPLVSGVPPAPSAASPTTGPVPTLQPELDAEVANDPDGDTLTLRFQTALDPSFVPVLDEGTAPVVGGSASFTPGVPGIENGGLWWRVRAEDPWAASAWSEVRMVQCDAVDESPTAPAPWAPLSGAATSSWPEIVLGPTTDAEGRAVSVIGWLQEGDEAPVSHSTEAVAGGLWRLILAAPLAEDRAHTFWGEAIDDTGLSSGPGPAATFEVDITNLSPPTPTWQLPADGERLEISPTTMRWTVGDDPDGDSLGLRLEWSLHPSFDSAQLGGVWTVVGGGVEEAISGLPEDRDLWFRARAEDVRGGVSGWAMLSAHMDAADSSPPAPVLVEPADGSEVPPSGFPIRVWSAPDPDGDEVSLSIELRAGAEVLWSATVPSDGTTTLDAVVDLLPGEYELHVVAIDTTGLSTAAAFAHRVRVSPDPNQPFDLGTGGWSCEVDLHGTNRTAFAVLLLLIGWRKRRLPS